ncbi:MAG: hypothetical protein IJ205_01500 [Bacteroidales bacterium]|nr:hypothetical protein [Bacteroidales bacterium]
MGLLIPNKHEHYHVSKEAAKEQRIAAEAEANARRYEADAAQETAREKMDHEAKMRLLEKDPKAYMRLIAKEKRQKVIKVVFIALALIAGYYVAFNFFGIV